MCEPLALENDLMAEAAEAEFPNFHDDVVTAKNFLKTQSSSNGDTMYDHLVDVVQRVLTRHHPGSVDNFEHLSYEIRSTKLRPDFDNLEDVNVPPLKLPVANVLHGLMKQVTPAKLDEMKGEQEVEELVLEEEMENTKMGDLFEDNFYFKQAGFGLTDSECFNVAMALKMLRDKEPIMNVRFFGKIFGTRANYYVAESQWTDEEAEKRLRVFEFGEQAGEGGEGEGDVKPAEEARAIEEEKGGGEEMKGEGGVGEQVEKEREPPVLPALPPNGWTPPVPLPQEKPGQGLNKKVYWVCNNPGEDWILLPDVKPHYLDVVRRTSRVMTGDLSEEVQSYPPLEGTEREYLRAAIARIAAATNVSPTGYYTLGSGEEEEDVMGENEEGGDIRLNQYYDGNTLKELLDLETWVHHYPYILKIGRLTVPPVDIDEGLGEEEEEPAEYVEPEIGPPLMNPVADDSEMDGKAKPWIARAFPIRGLMVLISIRWPGAVAYATLNKKSGCMYIGWAVKRIPYGYAPMPLLPAIQSEYLLGPEIMEMTDPTVADEEAWRIAHLPPEPPPMYGEGEGLGEGGLEEEEEEDEEEEEEEEE